VFGRDSSADMESGPFRGREMPTVTDAASLATEPLLPLSPSAGAWKREAAWAVTIGLAAGMATWLAFRMLVPAIVHVSTFDYWFESDGPAILNQLSDRFTLDNERANRHPLFALAMYPVVYALGRVARQDTVTAVGLAYAGLAALWSALFFRLLRGVGLRQVDASIFTGLALAGASAVFWFPVPETVAPAALTLLLALGAVVGHENTGRVSWVTCVLVSAATLAITVTNAVAGLLVCIVVLGAMRGVTAFAGAVVLVAVGQFVERLLFPHTAPFFLPRGEIETSAYLLSPLAGTIGDRLAGFFLHSVIIPPLQQGYAGYLSVQQAGWSSAPARVLLGWSVWMVLLAAGLKGLRRAGRGKLGVVLLGVLASQLAMALVFGLETFLYVLQSGPLLIVVAAFACLTPWRRWVLWSAAGLAVLAAMENGRRFTESAGLLQHRYQSARTYAEALSVLTSPADLIVLGLPPAAAYGWVAPPLNPRKTVRLTLLPQFESVPVARTGWHLHYERWSVDALEQLRQAGARYFASNYGYGIRADDEMGRYLSAHGTLLQGTSEWAIYALDSRRGDMAR
jgi:hypothetical protein